MSNPAIPFQTINWDNISALEYRGETGVAYWQMLKLPGIRLRMVTYSPGYLADHWCRKGHIVHCLQGSFISESENGDSITLTAGISYLVSDGMSSHRSLCEDGVKRLIIDGDFLKGASDSPRLNK